MTSLTAHADSRARVLLVDDDVELCHLMADYFGAHGIALESFHEGAAGLKRAEAGGVDLLLLDVMMPRMDGFEVLRELRRKSNLPVIMLTARTSRDDRIAGLNAGADDYLSKPFGPEELLARIRAVLRRAQPKPPLQPIVQLGRLVVDPSSRAATFEGRTLGLTSIEFDMLEFLGRAAGRTVTRDEMSFHLYQRPSTPFERAIDVHISHLRRKIEPVLEVTIRTVRGAGYLLAVTQESPE